MNLLNPGDFWLEWFGSGNNPVGTFENLDPIELKKLYQKIKNTDLYLVGYLSYEWGAALEGILPASDKDEWKTPLNWFGLYELTKENRRVFEPTYQRTNGPTYSPKFASSFTKESYVQAIHKIKNYLRAGDCYQVNLSQRFETVTQQSPWEIYTRLRQISPAPYSAFLHVGNFQILSSSPECFLEAKADGTLITKPIKGTRRRGTTPAEDARLKEELQTSEKENAELLMITDLERNDFGKICEPGSVKVLKLRGVETFAQVHHLVSTIVGKRKKECDLIDCLTAMMPGGSITGAPKIRAMEIIRELEPVNRGIYTGAIGWIGPNNTAHFNIAIRTMILKGGKGYFHAGGGIVIDSDPEAEYEETLTKAKGMMETVGLKTEDLW